MYGPSSPPPNEPEALSRLEHLSGIIAEIETDLDHGEAADFSSDAEYNAWRYRAKGALGFYRREERFLEKWIRSYHGKGEDRKLNHGRAPSRLARIAEEIRMQAQDLADEIEEEYTPRFSPGIPPPTVEAARERQLQVHAVKLKLQAAFTKITSEWTKYPLERKDLSGIKFPLQKILAEVEIELSFLRESLRDQPFNPMGNTTWVAECVNALDRAVVSGFQLTNKESRALDRLRVKAESARPIGKPGT